MLSAELDLNSIALIRDMGEDGASDQRGNPPAERFLVNAVALTAL